MYTDLFFDLDNTILDFHYASHLAFKELLEQNNKSQENAYHIYGLVNREVWGEFERGEIDAIELRGKRFNLFLKEMDWQGQGREWNDQYLQNLINHIRYIDGAKEIVQTLSKKYRLHITTNGLKEVQRPRITAAGLDQYLTSITVSDEIGVPKPQTGFFASAFESAGYPDKNMVLMIGDGYNSDIKGAHQYGIDSCWYNPDFKEVEKQIHNFEINRISDLQNLLK